MIRVMRDPVQGADAPTHLPAVPAIAPPASRPSGALPVEPERRPLLESQRRLVGAFLALHLHYGLSPSAKEIATVLGITLSSCESRIQSLITRGAMARRFRIARSLQVDFTKCLEADRAAAHAYRDAHLATWGGTQAKIEGAA